MTYDLKETSRSAGEPIEMFLFAQGQTQWRYTSADGNNAPWISAPINRGEIVWSQEDLAGDLDITVERDNPVALLFVPGGPALPVGVTIYRNHRGESPTEQRVIFIGRVMNASFDGPQAVLHCAPMTRLMRVPVPALTFQNQCVWDLYGPGCGVNAAAFRDTVAVTAQAGAQLIGPAFALRPTDWYRNGYIEVPGPGMVGFIETEFVVAHSGDTVTLKAPLRLILPPQDVYAYAGCERTEEVCRTKFNNLNGQTGIPTSRGFRGWTRIPQRNPHEGRLL